MFHCSCEVLLLLLAHCEKILFVLAFRQKIYLLRTENPAVDTRPINLPEGNFLHSHAGKVMAGKSQQATTDTAGKSRGQ
jgi:hypothetical protein